MKKAIILTAIAGSLTVIFLQSGVIHALFLFLIAGVVPGTSYSLPAGVMLTILGLAAWLIIFRFAALETLQAVAVKRLMKQQLTQKKRMPKRRYSQI